MIETVPSPSLSWKVGSFTSPPVTIRIAVSASTKPCMLRSGTTAKRSRPLAMTAVIASASSLFMPVQSTANRMTP